MDNTFFNPFSSSDSDGSGNKINIVTNEFSLVFEGSVIEFSEMNIINDEMENNE